jgi:hypothetical protein
VIHALSEDNEAIGQYGAADVSLVVHHQRQPRL